MARGWQVLLLSAALSADAIAADWQPSISEKYYTVTGKTGIALYESIGRNGPVLKGGRRTIALTEWDLRWRRDYQPEADACVLRSAEPLVKIVYTFPKAGNALSDTVAEKWDSFIAGIIDHEHVHGAFVVELANRIKDLTVGLRVEGDPSCKKIRSDILSLVEAEFARYQQKNSDFERSEMSEGGNVHNLILNLVN